VARMRRRMDGLEGKGGRGVEGSVSARLSETSAPECTSPIAGKVSVSSTNGEEKWQTRVRLV
jgi:hypothetical protein